MITGFDVKVDELPELEKLVLGMPSHSFVILWPDGKGMVRIPNQFNKYFDTVIAIREYLDAMSKPTYTDGFPI